MVKIPEDRQQFGRFEWERVLRRADLPHSVKGTGFLVATYASQHGTDIFPGRERLAADANLSEKSVGRHLTALRDAKLLTITKVHNRQAGRADEYALTVPIDTTALNLLDPEELTRPGDYRTPVSALEDTSVLLGDTSVSTTGHERPLTTSVPDQVSTNHQMVAALSTSGVGGADEGEGLIHLPTNETGKPERYAKASGWLMKNYRGDVHQAIGECLNANPGFDSQDAAIYLVEQIDPQILAANAA